MSRIKKLFRMTGVPVITMLIVMIIIVVYFQSNFFKLSALNNSLISWTPLILLSMGQAVVLISGGLDLSSGTAMAMMLCILGKTMQTATPQSGALALLLVILAATVVGLINGIAVGYLRLPPLVATFATSYMWLGIGLFIMPTPGGHCANWMRLFYDFTAVTNMPQWLVWIAKTIPTSFILIVFVTVAWFIISKTKTGRYFYAVGSNRDTAYDSGIHTARTMLKAYMINAYFCMFCALFYMGQNQSASARLGDSLTLRCIAAAVIGGIAITGGKGSVYLAIAGAVVLSLVNKIIFFANVPIAYQVVVGGVIIIAAIALSSTVEIRRERALLRGGGRL